MNTSNTNLENNCLIGFGAKAGRFKKKTEMQNNYNTQIGPGKYCPEINSIEQNQHKLQKKMYFNTNFLFCVYKK